MTTDERYQLRILDVLERTNRMTPEGFVFEECDKRISLHELQRMLKEMESVSVFIDSDGKDYKITPAGLTQLSELRLQREYEDHVRKVPKSSLDTNKATRNNITAQIILGSSMFIVMLIGLLQKCNQKDVSTYESEQILSLQLKQDSLWKIGEAEMKQVKKRYIYQDSVQKSHQDEIKRIDSILNYLTKLK